MTVSIESLSAHLDHEVPGEDHVALERHVAGCTDCRAATDVWRRASMVLCTAPRGRRSGLLTASTAVLVVLILIAGSAAAIATGLFSEVFRGGGNASAVASRPVSMGEAQVTGLPLPTSDEIASAWKIRQVYLMRTPSWSSVDIQYSRPRSVGIGIKVSSTALGSSVSGAEVTTSEVTATSGTDVAVTYEHHKSGEVVVWARFAHQGSWVEIRGSGRDLDRGEIARIVDDWIRQARK